MLERLPNELLAPIFALACTDGGKTAGALRLVSQHFQIIAAPYRFRTVAVAGVEPITDLVELLDHTPPELRIIEHMFVSDKTASELARYDGITESMKPRRGAKGGHASPLALLHALMCHAGPHVQSLTFLSFKEPTCARPLSSIPFPQLQILTLEVLGDTFLAARLIMPRVHIVTLSLPRKMHNWCLGLICTLSSPFPALQQANVHGLEACWVLTHTLKTRPSGRTEHTCYDIYPSLPRVDGEASSLALAHFRQGVTEQDNKVRFHEPQEFQWPCHYTTWRGRWAETVNSFSCE
jgi:hypothetical protein